VRTPILSKDIQDYLDGKGVGFALVEDSAKAMLKIASDASINGIFILFYFLLFSGNKSTKMRTR
jgi:hypothetical protein